MNKLLAITSTETMLLFLEYLKVLLSPQMVVGAVLLVLFILFRLEIRSLLSRIASIRWGQAEISAPQPQSENDSATIKSTNENFPITTPPELPEGVNVSPEDAERFRQAMLAERARAHFWEYRYLNHFFVIGTQRVLDWLISLPNSTTFTAYDALWQPFIATAEQRRTIIQVLEEHNLVVMHGDLIQVTPKGHEYAQWRGPLPQNTPEQRS